MGSSVYLKLKSGRLVSVLDNADKSAAEAMKAKLNAWVTSGQKFALTRANGHVEELTPTGVQAIEVVDLPTTHTNLDIV